MRRRNSIVILTAAIFAAAGLIGTKYFDRVGQVASAQTTSTPEVTATFDQTAALAKLRERIKGREQEPAEKVFKNIQTPNLKAVPAGRLLAVMEMGYARALGVSCTHCHVPETWESDERAQKQIAREMSAMTARINGELLKGIKNLRSAQPTVNCTTCHRGEVKPALNIVPR